MAGFQVTKEVQKMILYGVIILIVAVVIIAGGAFYFVQDYETEELENSLTALADFIDSRGMSPEEEGRLIRDLSTMITQSEQPSWSGQIDRLVERFEAPDQPGDGFDFVVDVSDLGKRSSAMPSRRIQRNEEIDLLITEIEDLTRSFTASERMLLVRQIEALVQQVAAGRVISESDLIGQAGILLNPELALETRWEVAGKIAVFVNGLPLTGYQCKKGLIVAAIVKEIYLVLGGFTEDKAEERFILSEEELRISV